MATGTVAVAPGTRRRREPFRLAARARAGGEGPVAAHRWRRGAVARAAVAARGTTYERQHWRGRRALA